MRSKTGGARRKLLFGYYSAIFVGILFLSSCISAEQRCFNDFSNFVNNVERDAPHYTAEDWRYCSQSYDMYTHNLDAYADSYTPEQNREIGRLKARYHKLVAKHYLTSISNFVNNLTNQMEGYTEEMTNTNENGESSGSENIVDELSRTVESISDIVDELN